MKYRERHTCPNGKPCIIGHWTVGDESGLIEDTEKHEDGVSCFADEWFTFCPRCGKQLRERVADNLEELRAREVHIIEYTRSDPPQTWRVVAEEGPIPFGTKVEVIAEIPRKCEDWVGQLIVMVAEGPWFGFAFVVDACGHVISEEEWNHWQERLESN